MCVRTFHFAGLGKVGIPDYILQKSDTLTEEEFEIMKSHAAIGYNTLNSIFKQYGEMQFLKMGIEITYCHHEHWDGTGYPRGLKGEEIPLSAQILSIVDVYDALTPDEQQVALKFHRLGRTSFKKTKLKRNYTIKYSYTPDWHHQSRIAAKKEYKALKLLYPKGVAVPEPIKQTRHVLVMGMIEGAELYRHPKLPDPQAVYNEILVNVKRAYRDAHIIHGDLSPFNIILQPNQHILIIDWPQNVTTKHPNAKELLERDLKNVLTFFQRKHGQKNKLKDALTYVTENSKN